jgi:hypothetical protein
MAVVSIVYDEGNKTNLGYTSVKLVYGDIKSCHMIFNSGDFVKDWFNFRKFIIMNDEFDELIANSSTVDHFIMDGASYDSAYLVKDENDKFELCYGDNWHSLGIEFFVNKGTTPTWEELKNLCKI